MPLPSRRRLKSRINRHLLYYPLLRMLLFKFWFRMAFLILSILGIFLAFYLPKMWQSTPDGFLPVIKVSGLDLTQARSLRKAAVKAMAQTHMGEANYCWQSAVANNPGDPDLIRGYLNCLLRTDKPERRYLSSGIGQSVWLLRLTQTNSADVELCARVYDHFRFHDVMDYVLRPLGSNLPPTAEVAFTKSLFHLGKIEEFTERVETIIEKGAATPELLLYKAAYETGWNNDIDAGSEMASAINDPARSLLANRLSLLASGKLLDDAGYRAALGRLDRLNESTLLDHIGYWNLLIAAGKKEEAAELASAHGDSPRSSFETIRFADVSFRLGLHDLARDIMKRFAPQFGHSPEVWTTFANLLVELNDWPELRRMALQIRQQEGVRDTLEGYSEYLEGRAELGQNRRATAQSAFQQAAQRKYEVPAIGLVVADNLLKLGYPEQAEKVFGGVENIFTPSFDFWQNRFTAALQTKNAESLLKAAANLYRFKPHDAVVANRYAAALILNRTNAEEAVSLTLRLQTQFPGSVAATVNHALALLMHLRTEDAKAQLLKVRPALLPPAEAAAYHLAWFEVGLNEGNAVLAQESARKIAREHLFPQQVAWLDEKLAQITKPKVVALTPRS